MARHLQSLRSTMKTKTKIKAGGLGSINHNQTRRLRIKSGVKAGGLIQHNQTRGVRIKSGVKAGGGCFWG
jgi:hypothetical protein